MNKNVIIIQLYNDKTEIYDKFNKIFCNTDINISYNLKYIKIHKNDLDFIKFRFNKKAEILVYSESKTKEDVNKLIEFISYLEIYWKNVAV